MSKFVKRSKLQKNYFDRVIHLYFEENLGYTQISHLVPIGRTTILEWVHRYLDSGLGEVIEMKTKKKKKQEKCRGYRRYYYSDVASGGAPGGAPGGASGGAPEKSSVDLERRVQELEKQLFRQTVLTDALNELINVAEENFRIQIRKKAGTKR